MIRWTFAALACCAVAAAPVAETPAMRGKRFLLGRNYNPPTMPASAYGNAWKHWGLKEKPAEPEYARLFNERYGLHPASYPNDGLPMGLRLVSGYGVLGGKGLTTDCLTCHAGSILGKSYVGLGNSAIDYHAMYAELNGGPKRPGKPPFQFTRVKGTTEAGAMAVYLLGYRETDLGLRLVSRDFGLKDEMIEDAPAWWTLRKKRTMYHTGGADTRSVRSIMQFMMSPLNFPSSFHKSEADFKDILAFLKSIEAPKYPLPIDAKLAARGKEVFADSCVRCHGTYGEKWTYPNKVVPLKEIGTDRARYDGLSRAFGEHYNKSWFAELEHGKGIETDGYQAPPLDGVWATAPYLHNGSVPTLRALLDSKSRPKVFTRSYRTGREDYDEKAVGWKVKVLDKMPDGLPPIEARKVYDTTKKGRGNGGHTYGDKLTEEQRTALIEYLKTL